MTGSMRKTGVALAIAPDPVTTIAGVVLIAGSLAMKGNEPASLATLQKETRTQIAQLKTARSLLESLSL
jgi:hypothetical protein